MTMDRVKRKDMYRLPFKHPQYGKYPFQYHLGINDITQGKTARRHKMNQRDFKALLTIMNADVQLINHFFKSPDNGEKRIKNLAKKLQLQKNLIMKNNQYPVAKGKTITFICNKSDCYEIDPSTGKQTHYICDESYCYAMI